MNRIRLLLARKATKVVLAPIIWSLGKNDQSIRTRAVRTLWRSL